MLIQKLLNLLAQGSFGWYAIAILGVILSAVIPYLLGSLNFAIILSGKVYHDDVRKHGSGNAGGTNMLRSYGKGAAIVTILFDMLKTAIGMGVGLLLFPIAFGSFGYILSGLFVILGHVFPLYYQFKGGKGVACVGIMILLMSPLTAGILFLLFVLIIVFTKFVSLASVMAMFLYPFVYNRVESFLVQLSVNSGNLTESEAVAHMQVIGVGTIIAFFAAAFIIYRHWGNIQRLREGKESKISFGKKEKPEKKDQEES